MTDHAIDGNVAQTQPTTTMAAGPSDTADLPEIISQLEIDGGSSGNDSSLGDEVSSVTTSMRAQDYEFQYEHGRRYQSGNDKYHLPNDIQEMDRLELQHLIWLELCGRRYNLAPLHEIPLTHVLDVGCGTGNWAIEFANLHPQVQVIGTDLSPIQPDYVPTNCSFYIDDATKEWNFHERFDYIHIRALTMGISDWDKLIKQAYKFLQPGGFLELQEFHLPLESPDGSIKEGSAIHKWGQLIKGVCAKLGIDSLASLKHADRLRSTGFQNVQDIHLHCPLGPWAKGSRQKRIGWMGRKDIYDGIEGISKKLFVKFGNIGTADEVQTFLDDCKAEVLDPAIHLAMPLDVCWGQRPLES